MSVIKYSKLTNLQIKQIIKHFCIDIDATKTSKLLNLNRHTINKHFKFFRELIYKFQLNEFVKVIGSLELDESYF